MNASSPAAEVYKSTKNFLTFVAGIFWIIVFRDDEFWLRFFSGLGELEELGSPAVSAARKPF
jgi:hypothetical protein